MRYTLFACALCLFLLLRSVGGDEVIEEDKRAQAISCILQYVDVDPKDGCVDANEVARAKNNCLNWLERGVTPRTETIMRDCDFDRNGCISQDDMQKANATCITKVADLDRLLTTFCPRAKDDNCNE